MKEYHNLLRSNQYVAHKYQKKGNIVIADTNRGKVVIKRKADNMDIINYLQSRQVDICPLLVGTNDKYNIYSYVEDVDTPKEQKINDLVVSVAQLHKKTSYVKNVDETYYKKIYEDLNNNIIYLTEYYNDLISMIDELEYYSPDEYLVARNYSIISNTLLNIKNELDNWFNNIKNTNKVRTSVIHNNLSIDHFRQDKHNYLVSWDKAKLDMPIFDLYKLVNNQDCDLEEVLKIYNSIYSLTDDELKLLNILVYMPKLIDMNNTSYKNCLLIKNEIKKMIKKNKNS